MEIKDHLSPTKPNISKTLEQDFEPAIYSRAV